ncbi:hypothetical protein GCM10023353_27340 [Tomitella cavernea]|uniref:Uncharacterized protein n=1 Tax=Tomitella cavernea TaxID=1387982 RepID=A0ABP9CU78_9ACTN
MHPAVDDGDDRGAREVATPEDVGVAGIEIQHGRIPSDLPQPDAVRYARRAEFDSIRRGGLGGGFLTGYFVFWEPHATTRLTTLTSKIALAGESGPELPGLVQVSMRV